MAINRFVTVDWDQPISSFVPRPFEAALMAGKQAQDELDIKLKDLESSTDPFAKLDLSGTIKIYDPTNPKSVNGVVDYDLGSTFENQKNAIVNNLSKERTKLVDDLWSQKITQNDFDRQLSQHKTKAKLAYGALSEAENKLKVVKKQNEEAGKNKEWALQGHLGEEYLKYNTDYVKDLQNNIFREYNPYSIAEKTDRPKEVVEYFDKLNPEILASSSGPTGTGYIRTHYREGVTKSKIENAFTDWYNNSRVKNDILLEGYDTAYRQDIDPDAKVKVNVPVSKDKSGKIKYQEEEMKWIDAFQEKKFNEIKDMAYGFESSQGKDDLKGDATFVHFDKMRRLDEANNFKSSVVESGAVVNNNIPEGLKKYVDKDGKLNVENIVKTAAKQEHIIIPGNDPATGKPYGSRPVDDLPKGWYKTTVQNYGEVLMGPDKKIHSVQYDKSATKLKTDKAIKEVGDELNKLAVRFDIDLKGKPAQESMNLIMNVLNSNAVTVSRGVALDPDVANSVSEEITGSDKKASQLHNVDIYDAAHKKKLSGTDYVNQNNIDPKTLTFMDYDFTAPDPGTKTFSVRDKDDKNKESIVRVTTRNINEQNHFKPAYEVVQNIQKFVQNKDVKNTKDASGFTLIGEPVKNNFDNTVIQAVYKPQRTDANGNIQPAEQYVARKDNSGNVKLISLDDYKTYTVDSYYKEGQGKTHTRGISNKVMNIATILE
jgi:hypothetical protein